MKSRPDDAPSGRSFSRREFLRLGGMAALAAGSGGWAAAGPRPAAAEPFVDVVIVGGGIAGLTAAFYLRDLKVLVLEKEDRAGGRILSSGPASYIGRPYGALKEIVETLGWEPWEIPAPLDAAFRDDRYYDGPQGLARYFGERGCGAEFERLRADILSAAAAYQDIPELDFTTPLARLDDVTARRWLADRKAPAEIQAYFDLAARSKFGASLDEISALALIPAAAFRLGGSTGDSEAAPEGTGAFAFEGGLAGLTQALARNLGSRFRPRAKVVRVAKSDTAYAVEYADEADRLRTVRATFVILAVPAPVALAVGSGILKPEARTLLSAVPYAPCADVRLALKEALPGRAFEVGLADAGIVTGYRDPSWALRGREGAAGARPSGLVVRAVPARLDDAGWESLTDEAIAREAVRAVSRLHPALPSRLTGREVVRMPRAYPVPAPGAFKRMARLNEISDGRVLLAGDHMIYPDFEAAADSGDFAAEKVKELI